MKNRSILIILLIIIFTLIGCNEEKHYSWLEENNELELIPSSYPVILEVETLGLKEGAKQISVIRYNKTSKELMYGSSFTIVKEVNGDWKELKCTKAEISTDAHIIILDKNMSATGTYDLSIFDDDLTKGRYKFISSIVVDQMDYIIEASFTID